MQSNFYYDPKTPANTQTCSFRVLTMGEKPCKVSMFARPKLARSLRRYLRGVFVFFDVLNLINEIDCMIRAK